MSNKNVMVLKNFLPPKEAGEYVRLICLTGKKKGEVYYITSERVVMGRGETADIPVIDMKSSREHAEIKKIGSNYIITDLGSQNGVIVNDLRVTQYTLKEADRIVIGQTVYKFGIISVEEKKLYDLADKKSGKNLADDQLSSEEEELAKVKEKAAGKKKRMMILVGIIVLVMVFMSDDEKDVGKKKKKGNKEIQMVGEGPKDVTDEFASVQKKKRDNEDKELEEKLKVIFQRGLREAREGNYFRAISEFNLALILNPNNARASFYLNRTMQILDEEIKQNFINARRAYDALKFITAKNCYCSNIRLLQNFPDDERYKAAMDNLKEIENKLGLDEGEIKCL